MIRAAAVRILWALPVLWAAATLVWIFLFVIPGDPARLLAGQSADPRTLASVRADWGLDRPPLERYLRYMERLAWGDLGRSYVQRRPVSEILITAFSRTAPLAAAAVILATVAGVLAGATAARRGGLADASLTFLTLAGVSLPTFWIGIVLMALFAVRLGWLPVSGFGGGVTLLGLRFPGLSYLVLPAVTLSIYPAALVARVTRASLLEQIGSEHLRAARARGLGPRALLWRHAFRNALPPIATLVGLLTATLLGGAIATEIVFSWPGLGQEIFRALRSRDLPVVEGAVLVLTAIFLAVNLAVDLACALIDPRTRR